MMWQIALLAMAVQISTTDGGVPLDVQVPSLLKALGFVRNLEPPDSGLIIGIVFDPNDRESESTKDRLMTIHKQLTRLRVNGQVVHFVPLPFEAGRDLLTAEVNVLIVSLLRPDAVERVARESDAADVVTFATDVDDLSRGLVLGMELSDGHPRFVLNRTAALAAGASFEAGFLSLCRIVETER